MLGVPVDNNRSEQVQAGHAEVLTFGGSVADFPLATDAQGIFQGVVCLTLVQTDLCAALHVRIEQPFHPRIGGAAFDADGALGHGGEHLVRRHG